MGVTTPRECAPTQQRSQAARIRSHLLDDDKVSHLDAGALHLYRPCKEAGPRYITSEFKSRRYRASASLHTLKDVPPNPSGCSISRLSEERFFCCRDQYANKSSSVTDNYNFSHLHIHLICARPNPAPPGVFPPLSVQSS